MFHENIRGIFAALQRDRELYRVELVTVTGAGVATGTRINPLTINPVEHRNISYTRHW